MKLLILGGTGMLGHKLIQELSRDFDVWSTIRSEFSAVARFEIFDQAKTVSGIRAEFTDDIEKAITSVKPDVVINAIGIIKQLPSSADVIATLSINSILPHRLAEFARSFGFRLICISTDCVFDGVDGGYSEADEPNARDLYGKSKALGEVTGEGCITLRTSIIGRELSTAHSLVDWFLSQKGKTVKGYINAIYSGFPTIVFADIIKHLVIDQKHLNGLYHISSEPISKFDLLNLVKEKFGTDIEIEPCGDFHIDRSLDSSKFREATGFVPLPWEEMIEQMASDPTPYDKWHI